MSGIDRRAFLVRTGLGLAAGALARPLWEGDAAAAPLATWGDVRAQFRLSPRYAHFGTFLLASHPASVRKAIARHRRGLDEDPVGYFQGRRHELEAAVLREAAAYLGASPADIALTDSTTMGLGLLYNGLLVREGQELLTTEHDFFATHEALALKASSSGASVRKVALYEQLDSVSEDEIVARLMAAVTEQTRVVAVTWVHSSTGLKIPVRRIADALAAVNEGRDAEERALLCVDGVHGFGVEDVGVADLGCDFLVAGCHKWLFGPRGTGLVWGRPEAWDAALPTIPSFTRDGTPGAEMTPGGFHSFEHRWALAAAFRFQQQIGKARVEARIHALNRRFKNGLAGMAHVRLVTPRSDSLSAGLVCFDVTGWAPAAVVRRLRRRGIVATTTPYDPSYVRFGPGILNTPAQVRRALAEISALA